MVAIEPTEKSNQFNRGAKQHTFKPKDWADCSSQDRDEALTTNEANVSVLGIQSTNNSHVCCSCTKRIVLKPNGKVAFQYNHAWFFSPKVKQDNHAWFFSLKVKQYNHAWFSCFTFDNHACFFVVSLSFILVSPSYSSLSILF